MISLEDCINSCSIESSALDIANKVAFNKGAGLTTSYDNKTYWDNNITALTSEAISEITNKSFEFSPLLRIVRTVNKRTRIIYIPTWKDKIVDRWLYASLSKLLADRFKPGCYAYRIEDIGIDDCQDDIAECIKVNNYFCKRDIASFFYSIPHDQMLDRIAEFTDRNSYLFKLLESRVKFEWVHDNDGGFNDLGVPFGTSIACLLANIYLWPLDNMMCEYNVKYFRYADDFLIVGDDPKYMLEVSKIFDNKISELGLSLKESHTRNMSFNDHPSFEKIDRFNHLGLQFCKNGLIRLAVEKQRKIIRMYRNVLEHNKGKIRKLSGDDKIKEVCEIANTVITGRIRSVAIVDYYLKHITDENQVKILDRLIIETVISHLTGKKFKKGHFKKFPPKLLRKNGLISLLHRYNLHKDGKININFLSLRNSMIVDNLVNYMRRRKDRIDNMRMGRKLNAKHKKNR